jgi:RecG-like helicase
MRAFRARFRYDVHCMNARSLLLVLLASGSHLWAQQKPAVATPPLSATEIYDPKALEVLRGKKGQIITVEGVIEKVGENRTGTFRYLNFSQNYRETLSLVFPVAKNAEFTMEKLNEWAGKKVRATGTVSEFSGNLQMTIEKWEQLKIIEEPKPAPAK